MKFLKKILGPFVLALALTVSASASSVNLTWQAGTGGTDPATGFNVYRAPSTNGTCGTFALLVGSINLGTPNWSDSTITVGNTYCYYVTSYDANGVNSSPSNTISVTTTATTTKPPTPTGLSGTFVQ